MCNHNMDNTCLIGRGMQEVYLQECPVSGLHTGACTVATFHSVRPTYGRLHVATFHSVTRALVITMLNSTRVTILRPVRMYHVFCAYRVSILQQYSVRLRSARGE